MGRKWEKKDIMTNNNLNNEQQIEQMLRNQLAQFNNIHAQLNFLSMVSQMHNAPHTILLRLLNELAHQNQPHFEHNDNNNQHTR